MKRKPPRRPGDGPYEIGYCKPPKHSQFQAWPVWKPSRQAPWTAQFRHRG